MVRPRHFEESQALDLALAAFWRRGYEACAISDLVEATGLQRQSLYNTFGDKQALFLAALRRYREGVEASLAPLRADDADLQSLRDYMMAVLAAQRAGNFGACLLVKTAFAPDIADAEITRAVHQGAEAVRSAFATVITRAVKNGALTRDVDPKAHAAYLYAVLNGLSALAMTGGSAKDVRAALSRAFSER